MKVVIFTFYQTPQHSMIYALCQLYFRQFSTTHFLRCSAQLYYWKSSPTAFLEPLDLTNDGVYHDDSSNLLPRFMTLPHPLPEKILLIHVNVKTCLRARVLVSNINCHVVLTAYAKTSVKTCPQYVVQTTMTKQYSLYQTREQETTKGKSFYV